MFGRIRSKGLKISAELHEKVAASSEPINDEHSEVLAVRVASKNPARKSKVRISEEYEYYHIYG